MIDTSFLFGKGREVLEHDRGEQAQVHMSFLPRFSPSERVIPYVVLVWIDRGEQVLQAFTLSLSLLPGSCRGGLWCFSGFSLLLKV
jgi:hypothetical protein